MHSIDIQYRIPDHIRSGIYKIITDDGYYYIGRACNLRRRCSSHVSDLKLNKHHNRYIQRKFNNSLENWSFQLVESVNEEQLSEVENKYLKPIVGKDQMCLNLSSDSSSFFKGHKHTKETKIKIANTLLGRAMPKEFCQKMSLIVKTRYKNNKWYDKHVQECYNRSIKCNWHHSEWGNFYGSISYLIKAFDTQKLDRSALYQVVKKRHKQHKGWSVQD